MTNEVRTRTAARVEIKAAPQVSRAAQGRRTPMQQAAFLARHQGETVELRETSSDGITTQHNRPGTMTMYKPTESHGYVPRTVSVSSLPLLLKQGWSDVCPDCGKEHLDRNGKPSTDPNLCSAREPVAVRVCPVCHKRIYDNMTPQYANTDDSIDDDPNVIKDETFTMTTPAERTRLMLDLHLWAKHPRQAQMMGRPSLPTAMKEVADSVQAAV